MLIGHMGGPFWAGREAAAWSVPKGEYGPEEDPAAAARREFEEELGLPVPEGCGCRSVRPGSAAARR